MVARSLSRVHQELNLGEPKAQPRELGAQPGGTESSTWGCQELNPGAQGAQLGEQKPQPDGNGSSTQGCWELNLEAPHPRVKQMAHRG